MPQNKPDGFTNSAAAIFLGVAFSAAAISGYHSGLESTLFSSGSQSAKGAFVDGNPIRLDAVGALVKTLGGIKGGSQSAKGAFVDGNPIHFEAAKVSPKGTANSGLRQK